MLPLDHNNLPAYVPGKNFGIIGTGGYRPDAFPVIKTQQVKAERTRDSNSYVT